MPRKRIDTTADISSAAGSFIKTAADQAKKPSKKSKDKRVQLLVIEDEWQRFQAFSHLTGTSANELINRYIRTTVETYSKQIDKYEKDRDAMQREIGVNTDE